MSPIVITGNEIANATMFAVVDPLFLRPPAGIREPDRVERVYVQRAVGFEREASRGVINLH